MQSVGLGKVLIVDDEAELATALMEMLSAQGYETEKFVSGKEALEALKEKDFDLLLTDLMMPEFDGISLLRAALAIDPNLVGVIMTGQGSVQTAVEAMKIGAFDYILKPFKSNVLLTAISRAMDVRRLRQENMQLRQTLGIYELGQVISYTLDLNMILSKVVDGARQQCDADEASILLPTREGSELYIAAVRGEGRDFLLGQRLPADKHIAGWVAQHREPLVLRGRIDDQRFIPFAPRSDVQLAVSMPLMAGGKLSGILNLSFTRPRRTITMGELKALSILAAIAGSALENARLHNELRIAEKKYRSIFENAIEGIFQTSPDGTRFATVNAAMARILGYNSPAELMSRVTDTGSQLFFEPSPYAKMMRTLETQDAVQDFTCQCRRLGGDSIWVSFNIHTTSDAEGFLTGYEGTMEDISERKRAEEEVASERNLLRTLIDNLPVSIYFKDLENRFITANLPHLNFLGAGSLEELIGKTDLNFLEKEIAERFQAEEREAIRTGNALINREELIEQDGVKKWVISSRVPIRNAAGAVVGIVGISRDITEHKNLESQLFQAQKMEAIGQLAGGIAHDFNNIITAIIGFGTVLQMRMKEDDPLKRYAEQILAAAKRAARLNQNLLAFSRKQTLYPKPVDLNTIVTSVEYFLKQIIGEDLELRTDLADEKLVATADNGQMEQLLVNLATNARDAMPQGGLLTISTSRVAIDAEFIKAHGYGKPGEYALIFVEDTGIGMDKKVQAKVFEPFFTTKEVGKGTGLGLSIVYGIVKQHNGYINLYSEPGRGTTFRIYIPLTPSTAQESVPEETAASKGGTETILLGEDDPAVRQSMRIILEQAGYTVIEAINGEETVAKFQRNRKKIRLLLLDIVMPKKNGRKVAEKIKKTSPYVRILFTSGYTANMIGRKGLPEEGVDFITKPFTPQALLNKVREVLDR